MILIDRASGALYRKSDRIIVEEIPRAYGPIPVGPDDVVLDLGAHIGLTSRMLLEKGARRSVAVEADPANLPLLMRNLDGLPATIISAAVGPVAGETTFYTLPNRGHLGSLLEDRGRKRLRVPVVGFGDLLAQHRPSIVKVDIEFGEYRLPELHALPDHVRVLAMEVHIRYAGIFASRTQSPRDLTVARREAADLIRSIEAQGFREVRRKDKWAKPDQPPALDDDTGLPAMCKAVDAVWER